MRLEKDILHFQIPVDNVLPVTVWNGTDDLPKVMFGLFFGYVFFLFQEFQ